MTYSITNLPQVLRSNLSKATTCHSTEHTTQGDLKVVAEGSSSDGEFFDAVNTDEAVELYTAVRELKPTHTGEIGFCCAGSGLAILQALEDNKQGTHHASDPFQTTYARNRGLRNVDRAQLTPRLDFHEDFPENVFPKLPPLQFVFIDASHLFDLTMLDFVLADKRLEVGGVVAFHDLWMPSLRKLFRYIIANRPYEIYRPGGAIPKIRKRSRDHLFSAVSKTLSIVPRAERIFSAELLHNWTSYDIANVVFLRKTAEDKRDFRHFKAF